MHIGPRTTRRTSIAHTAMTSLVLLLVLYTASYADVFWEDDFEDIALPGWAASYPLPCIVANGPCPTTAMPFSGSRSLEMDYTIPPPDVNGGYMGRTHTRTPDVWTRFYYRTHAFTYGNVGTKQVQQADLGTVGPNIWWDNQFGTREMGAIVQLMPVADPSTGCVNGAVPNGTIDDCNFYPNMTHIPFNDDQWYCVETHMRMNTPGVADGALEIFIGSIQTMGHYKQLFRPAVLTGQSNPDAQFSLLNIFRQQGFGTKWFDKFAIGSTRIGCGGALAPSAAPSAPLGITAW